MVMSVAIPRITINRIAVGARAEGSLPEQEGLRVVLWTGRVAKHARGRHWDDMEMGMQGWGCHRRLCGGI